MKPSKMSLVLVLGISGFGISSFATNPQIRICRTTGGVFHEIRVESDQVGFCEYGSALIDAVSVLETTSSRPKTEAVEAFENSPAENCMEVQGVDLKGEDVNGRSFDLCGFDDGSVIDRETLSTGKDDSETAKLKKALSIRY